MPKSKKEHKDNRYTTIIALKESVKRLTEARNKWKEDNKNFSQVGIMPFSLYLLDFYETHKDKKTS